MKSPCPGRWYFIFLLLLLGNTINAQRADFSVNKMTGCSPLQINFTNTSTGFSGNVTYKWDFDNGNTSTITNPSAIFYEERDYNVKLTVTSNAGSFSQTKTITVYKKPVADFTVDVTHGCLPWTPKFTGTATSVNPITTYAWDFGDGNTVIGKTSNVTHTYNVDKKATVSLTVSDANGCSNTIVKNDIVETFPAITAAFSADQRVLCKISDPVQFTNTSTGPGTLDYSWNFGDGTTSTQYAPLHVFSQKGIYSVSLTVNSSTGCSATVSQNNYLNVASYQTDFTVQKSTCVNDTLTFTNTSNAVATKTTWDMGDGTQAEGASVKHVYKNVGDITVTLTNYYNSCQETVQKTITINPLPAIQDFTMTDKMLCDHSTVTFTDNTPGAVSWEWKNGYYGNNVFSNVQSPSLDLYNYVTNNNEKTTYERIRLKVTDKNGCSDSLVKDIHTVLPSVTMNVMSTTGSGWPASCDGPLEIKSSTWSNVEIVKYDWNFGDGYTTQDASPANHTYTNPGRYTITLKYTTKGGCTGTLTAWAEVDQKLDLDFAIAGGGYDVCGNNPVTFVGKSNNNAVISGGWWDWGNGTCLNDLQGGTCKTQYPVYDKPGTYTVIWNAYSSGCAQTIKHDITVHLPIVKITGYQNTCQSMMASMAFTQENIGAETLTWDFGDGTTLSSFDNTVYHTYTKSGFYNVKLRGTNGGCVVVASYQVAAIVRQHVVLSASQQSTCIDGQFNAKVSLDANPPNPFIENYTIANWQYGDATQFDGTATLNSSYISGTTGVTATLSGFKPLENDLRVILKESVSGCLDTSAYIKLQVIGAHADFDIANDKKCFNENAAVTFTDKSLVNGATINKWEWNFGDGQTSVANTGAPVTHVYTSPGTYNATLKITDDQSCSSTTNATAKVVQINGPMAAFSVSPSTDVFLNTPVSFTNTTKTTGTNGNTTYNWDFGFNNQTSSASGSPTFTYTKAGTYTVTLTTTDPDTKCASTTSATINVKDFNSSFSIGKSFVSGNNCPPVLVQFKNTSTNYTSVKWDFGDGVTANVVNPSHIYDKPGKYIITLVVTGNNGDVQTYTDEVDINAPTAAVNADVFEICKNQSVQFSATITNGSASAWDFGDGSLINSTDLTQTHVYKVPGQYAPAIILKDENGCAGAASLAKKVNVHADPAVNIQTDKTFICKGNSITLNAVSSAVSYSWTPDDGSLDNPSVAAPKASPVATTTYSVVAKDDIGCANQANVTLLVVQPITVKANNDTAVCIGNNIQFFASGASTYQWINFTDGLSSTNISNPATTVKATETYTVKGFDEYGCFTSTADVKVTALDLPTVDAGADVKVLAANPVQLNAQTSNDVVQWVWTPDKYLSCNNCAAPVCTPISETTYKVTVINKNKCQASDEVTVKLECEASRVRIPNVFSPNGDGNNDLFVISGIGIIKHLTIFDRWGTKVFERSNFVANDRGSCWDGTRNGLPVPGGTYVYFAEMQCETGEPFAMRGTVVLIR
jgi:gliding motility-associated-like protein